MSEFKIGTAGETATEARVGKKYMEAGTVHTAQIVDVKYGTSKKKGTPYIEITIMSLEEEAAEKHDYGTGTVCTVEYYYSEKSAESSNKRLANFRDTLGLVAMDNISAGSVEEYVQKVAPILKGQKANFLIVGEESPNGTVYAKLYSWDFMAPVTPQGREKLEKMLADLKAKNRVITKQTAASEGGSTTDSPMTPPPPPGDGGFENF